MSRTIVARYASSEEARAAGRNLEESGIDPSCIHYLGIDESIDFLTSVIAGVIPDQIAGLMIPKEHLQTYTGILKAGGALVAVEVDDHRVSDMEAMLNSSGSSYVRADPLRGDAAVPMGRHEVEAADDASDYDSVFRLDYKDHYGESQGPFEQFAPAYKFGFDEAKSARHLGDSWADVEPLIREKWEREDRGNWAHYRGAVKSGWSRYQWSSPNAKLL